MSGTLSHRPEQQVQQRGDGPEAKPSGGGAQSGMLTQLKRAGSYAAGRAIVQPKSDATSAAASSSPESIRLDSEMKMLAAKGAWNGVARTYAALQALEGVQITAEQHELAAMAYRVFGDTVRQKEALEAALVADPGHTSAQETLDQLDAQYASLHVTSKKKKKQPSSVTAAVSGAMPFAPDLRKSLEFMVKTVNETGNFHGMIPADVAFTLNGEELSLEVGESVNWSPDSGKEKSKEEGDAESGKPEVNDRVRDKAYADMDQAIEWGTPEAIIYQFEELQKLGVEILDHHQQAYDQAKAEQANDAEQ